MKIVLIPSKGNYPNPTPCFDIIGQGLPYIAGSLKSAGYTVEEANLNYEWCHGGAPLALERMLLKVLSQKKPDMLGLNGLSADYNFIRDTITLIRRISSETKIVLGGGIINYDETYIFNTLKPDYSLIGDAEESIMLLIKSIESRNFLNNIPNLLYWEKDMLVMTNQKQLSCDLNILLYPDYSPFQIEESFRVMNQADNSIYSHTQKRSRFLPISLSRISNL